MASLFQGIKEKLTPKARRRKAAAAPGPVHEAMASNPALVPELRQDIAAATGGAAGEVLRWEQLLERLRYYRGREESGLLLLRLQIAAVEHYQADFAAHTEDWVEAVGSNDPVLLVCNRYLQEGKPQQARQYAEPYLQYLDRHPELYNDGHLELSTASDRAIYELFREKAPEEKLRPDGIVQFILLYEEILRAIPVTDAADYERRSAESERRLLDAVKLSPFDARLWLELARCRRAGDTPAFRSTVRRAMDYAAEEQTLGEAYAELAMSRLGREPELASVLCTLAQVYGAAAIAPRVLMGQMGIAPVGRPAAERMAKEAGIRVGLNPQITELLQNTGE